MAATLQSFAELRADFIYSTRLIRRSPGFALVAILSLALGVGANTLVFSVVNALVLRPLPVAQPEQLVFIQRSGRSPGQSYPNYRDLRDRNTTLAGLIGYRVSPMDLENGQQPTRVWGYLATGNYFDLLGVQPALGRFFHQEDDRQPGASPYVVLSDACWRARFGANPAAIGQTIRVNRRPYTVLGVAPRGFQGTELFYQPELWVPVSMQAQIEAGNPWLEARSTFNLWIAGRLKPQVTPSQAEANLNAIAAELAREDPGANQGMVLKLTRPGLLGDVLRGPVRNFSVGVLILSGLVLLVASMNLAGMLAARGADRQHELAIRVAIGASRGRLVRQLLAETMTLAIAGGAAGALVAWLGARVLSAWRLPTDLPLQFDVTPDARVFLFALAVSTAAGLVFGLAPARQAARTDPNVALKGGAAGRTAWRRWALRELLIVAQVAVCFVLVTGAAVSLRALQRAIAMPIGMAPDGVAVAGFDLGLAGYTRPAAETFRQRVLEDVRRLPGVQEAAFGNAVPLSIDVSSTSIYPEDQPDLRPADVRRAVRYQVSPGYFRTLGIPMVSGRDATWADGPTAPRVAIVNQRFATEILRSRTPVGRRFRYGRQGPFIEVVGVVADGKYVSLTENPQPALFDPILQVYNAGTMLLVRSNLPEGQIVREMRRTIAQLDPSLPLRDAGALDQLLELALFPTRAGALALGFFGVIAIMLAMTGIHGVVAYAVVKRQRELGIRIAIGASRFDVLRAVLTRMVVLLASGVGAGVLLALAAQRVLSAIVYQSPADSLTLAVVAGIMIVVGVLACWRPARQSLRVDPISILRAS